MVLCHKSVSAWVLSNGLSKPLYLWPSDFDKSATLVSVQLTILVKYYVGASSSNDTEFRAVEGKLLWQIGSGVEGVTERQCLLKCLPESQSSDSSSKTTLRYKFLP